ncbi:acetolactate synthase AlsS [Lacipirellula sp.]|uniref:acetolactate synthase AlsS n=1 Tax=Lacipirellula sp. TaxID=2691419 RepID=UPI003D13B4D5
MAGQITGAQLLVNSLERLGVEYIFGIPGAKIDSVFNALADSGPRLIVCRHEQNAAFMAGCIGRLTGKPGVALVTSGPGVGNLATGMLTATTEGDPLVAIGGAVSRSMKLKQTHQNLNNVDFARPVTKSSVEVDVPESIPEIVANAFRIAARSPGGATFISLPQDVALASVDDYGLSAEIVSPLGAAAISSIAQAVKLLQQAKQPVLLLGAAASTPANAAAVRRLLAKFPLATVETFEAAGTLSRELAKYFAGRVGLFRNQPGDRLLAACDLVFTVGFNPVEYDPEVWNAEGRLAIIHLDAAPMVVGHRYHPVLELTGDVATTLDAITTVLPQKKGVANAALVASLRAELDAGLKDAQRYAASPVHPLRFIHDLQSAIDDDTTVVSDIGSHYMWLARHLYCYQPRHLLFSNGQQTLGVALPWAMATKLARPNEKVISISGDGGFLFSATELETAVREKLHFVHFIWRDGSYNMVAAQEQMKYGRTYGIDFGGIDVVKFAESFGAHGFALRSADEILPTLEKAQAMPGPVLIDVPIDYQDNMALFESTDPHRGH